MLRIKLAEKLAFKQSSPNLVPRAISAFKMAGGKLKAEKTKIGPKKIVSINAVLTNKKRKRPLVRVIGSLRRRCFLCRHATLVLRDGTKIGSFEN